MAAPRLLASYERSAVRSGLRNCDAARRHSEKRAEIAAVYREAGDLDRAGGGRGARLRRACASVRSAMPRTKASASSSATPTRIPRSICADPGAEIPSDPLHYIPTTAPGARMPSVLMTDGTPIFDRLGLWFTLVCFGVPPSEALVAAAARRGVPLDVLRIDDPDIVQGLWPRIAAGPAGSACRLARRGMRGRARGRCHRVARGGVWRAYLIGSTVNRSVMRHHRVIARERVLDRAVDLGRALASPRSARCISDRRRLCAAGSITTAKVPRRRLSPRATWSVPWPGLAPDREHDAVGRAGAGHALALIEDH